MLCFKNALLHHPLREGPQMGSRKKKRKSPPKQRSNQVKQLSKENDNLTLSNKCYCMSNPTILEDSSPNKKPLTILERLNKYSDLIVGIATVLLVFVTGVYIFLSWKIATETKRLADISIDQFKIRSYPAFLILRTDPTYTDGKYKDEIKILNKGEISSHKTSFLVFYVTLTQEPNQSKKLSFLPDWTYVYRDKETENIQVVDYSKNILPNSGTKIGTENMVPDMIISNLKFQIIFIRHKVPYDEKYSYESHAFAWEVKKPGPDSKEAAFHWETLPDSRKESLIDNLFNSDIIAPNRENKIINFLVDYPSTKPVQFHKRNLNGNMGN